MRGFEGHSELVEKLKDAKLELKEYKGKYAGLMEVYSKLENDYYDLLDKYEELQVALLIRRRTQTLKDNIISEKEMDEYLDKLLEERKDLD